MTHVIEAPRADDAASLGSLQLRAWLQTYPCEDAGIDENWIREHRGSSATEEGIAQWREFLEAARQQPDLLFCRVVRSGAEIVGFLCGRRDEVVTLGPMYLLEEAQGRGIGGRLMGEFLTWAGSMPMRLWVTDYNERAIRFYQRYGFKATGERELWQGKLPNVRMARDITSSDNLS
ncbi:Acetyltransferase (GNAT) domain-containing protein [Streptosporangium canum]|uniref:Acetyltransferase (GNAT) domain-containing protein n=1 Tax=Streptosporangium canum TaxID=324952 RepID=A0A1I4BUN1_9ACTN|nr:GNAT family N-acetyltransferase [Streptosporangium canum]SFK72498.1 Acetyltransferase (GNAT) domain-containing protein [Streptosporangium canum]